MRRTAYTAALVVALCLMVVALAGAPAVPALAATTPFPPVIDLGLGATPEGIAIGRGTTFYVGSLSSGAIMQGDLRTGATKILVQPFGSGNFRVVGLKYDPRTNTIFAAGGMSGKGYAFDAGTGKQLAAYQLAQGSGGTLINDLVITTSAVYFTDSFRAAFYRLPLGPGGRVMTGAQAQTIPLTGDFQLVPNNFNSNGIVASNDGRWLIIGQTATGTLFRVDPASGKAQAINLGGQKLPGNDGLVLAGPLLYAVQGSGIDQVSVVRLSTNVASGTVVQVLKNSNLSYSSTAGLFGNSLYVVNARFNVAPPTSGPAPNVRFQVVRVDRVVAGQNRAQSTTVNLPAARQELASTGTLRLGILIGTSTTKDPATGQLSGVGVDLGNELARRLGVSFQPSAYNVARDMVADLRANKIDAGIWVIDPANANQWDFSAPYLVDSMTYVVRSDSAIRTAADADRAGVRIATTEGSVFYDVLQRQLKKATLVGIDFTDQMPQLRSGQVDAFGFIRSRLVRDAAQQSGLRVVQGQFGVNQTALVLPKGRPDALAFTNQALGDLLANGFIQQSVARAGLQGLQVPATRTDAPTTLPVAGGDPAPMAAGAGASLLLVGLAVAEAARLRMARSQA